MANNSAANINFVGQQTLTSRRGCCCCLCWPAWAGRSRKYLDYDYIMTSSMSCRPKSGRISSSNCLKGEMLLYVIVGGAHVATLARQTLLHRRRRRRRRSEEKAGRFSSLTRREKFNWSLHWQMYLMNLIQASGGGRRRMRIRT